MRRRRQPWICALLAGAALHAPTLDGQEPDSTPVDSATAEAIRARAADFARAQLHLDTLLERVFEENPELWERLDELETVYLEVMVELDPETGARRARFRDLETAYTTAVLADDTARVQALLQEGAELRRALETTATEAGRRPGLSGRVDAFRTEIVARLSQIDAAAVRLLAEENVAEWLIMASVVGFR